MKKSLLIVTFSLLFTFVGVACNDDDMSDNLKSKKVDTTKQGETKQAVKATDNNTNEVINKDSKPTNEQDVKARNEGKVLASDFTLMDLEGKEVTLSSFRGKKVWVNIWASWCPPCKAEMPDLNRVNNEVDKNELVILTVNSGESKDKPEKFLKDNNYSFRVLLDEEQKVGSLYSVRGIPTSIFINKDGYITDRIAGSIDYDTMLKYIENIK